MFLFKIYKTFPILNPITYQFCFVVKYSFACLMWLWWGAWTGIKLLGLESSSTAYVPRFLGAVCLACAQNTATRAQGDVSYRQHNLRSSHRRNGTNKPHQQCHYHRPMCCPVGTRPTCCSERHWLSLGSVAPVPREGRLSVPRTDVAETWLMPLWRAGLTSEPSAVSRDRSPACALLIFRWGYSNLFSFHARRV